MQKLYRGLDWNWATMRIKTIDNIVDAIKKHGYECSVSGTMHGSSTYDRCKMTVNGRICELLVEDQKIVFSTKKASITVPTSATEPIKSLMGSIIDIIPVTPA